MLGCASTNVRQGELVALNIVFNLHVYVFAEEPAVWASTNVSQGEFVALNLDCDKQGYVFAEEPAVWASSRSE